MSIDYDEDDLEGFELTPSIDLDTPIGDLLDERAAKLKKILGKVKSTNKDHIAVEDILELEALLAELQERVGTSGFDKWYVPGGPYSIDRLTKHKAFYKATRDYRELLILGGNRSSKTTSGCYLSAVTATGMLPSWWEGVTFDGPVNNWAVGSTSKSVKETLQEALLGPVGNLGTGILPKSSIVRTTAKQGVPGGIDTVYVRHEPSGGISTITFMSAEQGTKVFMGSARHIIHIDEPTDEAVYNECLIRTMTTNGRMVHSVTPKKGLTRMLANFLADCDLLEGTQEIKGLKMAKALMDLEELQREENRG